MTVDGTSRYADPALRTALPPIVLAAVELAESLGFPLSVHPAQGRLLAVLAGGVAGGGPGGVIGETGTGAGVGVAWLASAAPSGTRIVSIERDPVLAAATAELFADLAHVTVRHGEANQLVDDGPFDLLVLDARAADAGPLHWATLDPTALLRPDGVLVDDDQWPMTDWPPRTYEGEVDHRRIRWLEHPALLATELTVAEGYSAVVARRRPAG